MEKINIDYIKEKLKNSYDIKYREIETDMGIIFGVFIDDLCDSKFISEYIFNPLIQHKITTVDLEYIKKEVLPANSIGDINSNKEAIDHILSGDLVLIFSFANKSIYCEAKGYVRRSVGEPSTENVIKGPREGFTEAFVDNVSMIRRKIKNSDLKFEPIILGSKSNTVAVICYIEGVAPKKLVDYIRKKVTNIKLEFILDTNYIEEELKNKNTAFDTIGTTEKPDVAASKLLEGKVAIIVDGTPFVITAPYFFVDNFQTPDDYYSNRYFTNISRLIRVFSFFSATLLSGVYLAITTFHFSLIPEVIAVKLSVARAGVPLPTVIELLLMTFFFELLREAGIRLPQLIGQAMSIVGALILGDAAVGAGLASQSTVVIVALSSISSFLVPKLYGALSIWNIIIIVFSSVLGLPGFYIGFFIFISHMAGLESCGYPYLFPLGTLESFKFKDILYRKDLSKISNSIFDRDDYNE
ncbi:spore germination protein [Clostridium sp. CF011]|uniref:spore germination protein n=1 Tax=unclassified Clostridium TaxID=2614128 RepID=UPI001C0E1E5F|nr:MULTISPECIES: spore germination protein [unclassified Clostridium]MBU3090774.1 spore germination protein [Clostridium sp. CF011]MBW9144661.1 spore germination protein [Clostridium sp. CM027]UVE40585.1 spore germination protein [Clostridium sp. CM027]WAG69550.1 spore germination protein [Clostridium sp. CF011]